MILYPNQLPYGTPSVTLFPASIAEDSPVLSLPPPFFSWVQVADISCSSESFGFALRGNWIHLGSVSQYRWTLARPASSLNHSYKVNHDFRRPCLERVMIYRILFILMRELTLSMLFIDNITR
ncbi:hypothetical protein K438DRAFT_1778512 [Mycena galopus ATCC 62051]|nr:hypothetical protein K438DRAFT_1778512 [Mycena galopus ATCC 62051]